MDAYRSALTESETVVTEAALAAARREFAETEAGQKKLLLRRYFNIAASCMTAGAIIFVILGPFAFQLPARVIGSVIGALLVTSILLVVAGYVIYENGLAAYRPNARAAALQSLNERKEKALVDSSLPALLLFNREDMRQYHEIATTVARRASRLSALAMTVGFIVLVAGAIAAIRVEDETSKIVVGGLTAMGGLFSGYISRTFFTAEDKAVNQLYKYWQQPREASYLLAAERVAKDLSDEAQERELAKVITKALSIVLVKEQLKAAEAGVLNGTPPGTSGSGRRTRGSKKVQPDTERLTPEPRDSSDMV